jgi:hypothetical protein
MNMRMTTVFLSACFAVAFAVATTASAQTVQNKAAGTTSDQAQAGTMAPSPGTKPKDARPSRVINAGTVAPLTEQDCTDMGGTVKGVASICLSEQACFTKGEAGDSHTVCIKKQ